MSSTTDPRTALKEASFTSPWPVFAVASIAVFLVSIDGTALFAACDALRSGFPHSSSADLSIVRQDEHLEADVVLRRVLDMNHVLCASAGYLQAHGMPLAPEDLSRHHRVRLRTTGSWLHRIGLANPSEHGRRIEVQPGWCVQSSDDETTCQAALASAGITLLSELALPARTHPGQMRHVLAPWVSVEGRVIHTGRQVGTAEGRIVGPDGKLYAHPTTTCMIFERPAAAR